MIENDMGLTLKEQLEHEIERLRAEVEREQIAKAALQKLYDRAKQERDEAREALKKYLEGDYSYLDVIEYFEKIGGYP